MNDRSKEKIIDFHVHCFPDDLAGKTISLLEEKANEKARLDGTVANIKRSMKKAGIDWSVVQNIATKPSQTETINDWAASIQGEGIISFGTIHPEFSEPEAEIERIRDSGLPGIKFHPDYQEFYVDEEKFFPIYEKIIEKDLIILFHSGIDIGLPESLHCPPSRLKKVVETFPEGKIIAAHMGGYKMWDRVEEELVGSNVYLDTSYSLRHMPRKQFLRIVENHGSEKILFATDSPWEDQTKEVERIKDLNLEEGVEAAIFYENSRELLGNTIDQEEIISIS
ncbi:MAG: amidohydrolase family protein [Halanaerobiaceae bacterium]